MRERTPFKKSQLQKLPKLKLLITSGMRNSSIDVITANKLGIKVCGTPAFGRPTADLAWGLIISLARKIPMEDQNIRNGIWQESIGVGLKDKNCKCLSKQELADQTCTMKKVRHFPFLRILITPFFFCY